MLEGLRIVGRGLRALGRGLRAAGRWIMHSIDRVFERRLARRRVKRLEQGFEELDLEDVHPHDVSALIAEASASPHVHRIIITWDEKLPEVRFSLSFRER